MKSLDQIKRDEAALAKRGCPACGSPMVERVARVDGHPFLGCSTYPKCKATRPHPDEYEDMDVDMVDSLLRWDGQ